MYGSLVAGCFRDLLKIENVKVDFIEYIYIFMHVSEIRDIAL